MGQLAATLQAFVQVPVVDRTGLTGAFDFNVSWTTTGDLRAAAESASFDDVGDMFTALQDRLGLKLESTRGPVDVIVIDSVEQPTPD